MFSFVKRKNEKFEIFWDFFLFSEVFTLFNNQTKETSMTENIKKNNGKTTSYKKIKKTGKDFPTCVGVTLCKKQKKGEFFRLPEIYPMKGDIDEN